MVSDGIVLFVGLCSNLLSMVPLPLLPHRIKRRRIAMRICMRIAKRITCALFSRNFVVMDAEHAIEATLSASQSPAEASMVSNEQENIAALEKRLQDAQMQVLQSGCAHIISDFLVITMKEF